MATTITECPHSSASHSAWDKNKGLIQWGEHKKNFPWLLWALHLAECNSTLVYPCLPFHEYVCALLPPAHNLAHGDNGPRVHPRVHHRCYVACNIPPHTAVRGRATSVGLDTYIYLISCKTQALRRELYNCSTGGTRIFSKGAQIFNLRSPT